MNEFPENETRLLTHFIPDTLVQVFKLPIEVKKGFCFNGGIPVEITLVDFFRLGDIGFDSVELFEFVTSKQYYNMNYRYLILHVNGTQVRII